MPLPPRVADLVADPILKDVWVVAGSVDMERIVENLYWYDGGACERMNLTRNLIVCDGTQVSPPYRIDGLLRWASDANASALLIIAPRVRPLLSSVRLAERLAMPVLWLERASPLALSLELLTRIRAPEQVRARTVEQLLRALSKQRTGREILSAAEKVLQTPLSLVTSTGAAILGEPVEFDDDLRLQMLVAQRGRHHLVHPVLDPEEFSVTAWLACRFERADIERLDVLAVGLAMTEPFIRSWVSSERARVERDVVFQAHLLAQIIAGGDSVSRDIVEASVSLGWRLQDWHVGIHVILEAARSSSERETLLSQFQQALASQGVRGVAGVDQGDSWALWVNTYAEPGLTEASGLLRAARLASAEMPRQLQLAVGIGRPHQGPAGLALTLGEARDAADLARSHHFRPAVEHADELGVARLLATWQRSEVTQAFAETALAPLQDPACRHLLTTLLAFLESGGSIVVTAQVLGVHRNTVTTRIRQIRERLNVDLDSPSHRLALQVACRALQV